MGQTNHMFYLHLTKTNNLEKQFMEAKIEKKRVVFLDIAKVFSIILVVIGHFDPSNAPAWWNKMIHFVYTFHVPVFLFVSGYIYIYISFSRKQSYLSFISKKFKRLMIPYFVVSVIIISLKLISGSGTGDYSAMSFIRMFYMPEAAAFLWFIYTLFTFFAIVGLCQKRWQRVALLFLSIVIAALPKIETSLFCINNFQYGFVYFMLGVFIADYCLLQKILSRSALIISLILFVSGEIYYLSGDPIEFYFRTLPLPGIMLTLSLCHAIERHYLSFTRACILMAPAVYVIYFFHTTVEGAMKVVIGKLETILPANDGLFLAEAIISITLAIVIPLLLYHLVLKRYKLLRFLFGLTS